MKTIFFGTPTTAVPYLEHLYKNHEIVAVVTQTDKPAKRGQHIQKSPVKEWAITHNIPVIQPATLKDPIFLEQLQKTQAELGIVVAYGKILPKAIIEIFSRGIYNIHFSLLPQLRGAAPIQWAIIHGDKKTGVSLFRISETLDTGNILSQKEIEIDPQENTISLENKLIALGIQVMDESIQKIENNQIEGLEQRGLSTHAPLIKKEHTQIHWNKPALEIEQLIRGLIKIGAYCTLPSQKHLKIFQAHRIEKIIPPLQNLSPQNSASTPPFTNDKTDPPGTICAFERGRGFIVKCEPEYLFITQVQPEGKRTMNAWSFLQGSQLKIKDPLL